MKKVFSKKSLLVVFSLFLLLVGCDKGEGEKATEDVQEWTGKGAQTEEKRIESLKASLYENPDNFELLSALGDAYFESAKYKEAIAEYDKALKINPKDADCLNDKGLAYFYLGNSEAALEVIDKAIKVDPTYKHAWLSKGYMLLSLGKYVEAEVPFKKVKELDPLGPLGADADNFLAKIDVIKDQQ